MSDIEATITSYLVPGLAVGELTVLVGEEGIGKGLWAMNLMSTVSRAGQAVLIIASEDDPERTLRPRLDAAMAALNLVYIVSEHPTFPRDLAEIVDLVREHDIRLIVLDPWVSTVTGGLRLRDSQDARRALDPLTDLARRTGTAVLAIVHPNRGEGSLRDRVGLTAVLRQSARCLLYALEDPEDDTRLFVGIEKSNSLPRSGAEVFEKVARPHPVVGEAFRVVPVASPVPSRTISEWDEAFARQRDGRRHTREDQWAKVLAVADSGLVSRTDIVDVYGGSAGSADKAISAWRKSGRLVVTGQAGVYEVSE